MRARFKGLVQQLLVRADCCWHTHAPCKSLAKISPAVTVRARCGDTYGGPGHMAGLPSVASRLLAACLRQGQMLSYPVQGRSVTVRAKSRWQATVSAATAGKLDK